MTFSQSIKSIYSSKHWISKGGMLSSFFMFLHKNTLCFISYVIVLITFLLMYIINKKVKEVRWCEVV